MSKPYMPLMMGDWIKGTRGMRAEVKGVYIGLLIHQYDQGYLPVDLEELTLIEPEVGKVWVILKTKFEEFEPGKLRNKKLEEVRDFWNKQASNGSKGGRPKKGNPDDIPNENPKPIPNNNHNNDLDFNTDLKNKIEADLFVSLGEIYIDQERTKWGHKDFESELTTFREKVRGSPENYFQHGKNGLRLAFQSQLRNAKPKSHVTFTDRTRKNSAQILGGQNYSKPL